jgi:hypothetical protein
MSSSSWRPFVIATVPVIGSNGVVGGVSINASGVVDRCSQQTAGQLRRAWLAAMQPPPGDMARASDLRKVSLRRLEVAIAECRQRGEPLPLEMRFLAGLQRVRYVLVYPETADIVLAGPAEGWAVNDLGEVVGPKTGRPVLQLDDLIVALRSAAAAASGPGITCSIDPTEAGLARFQRLTASGGLSMSASTLKRLERTLGPSVVTVTGVDADTHFAQVLVASDFLMKRLAMGFEPPPVEDLPSYLTLLQNSADPPPGNAIFRLWLSPNYDTLLRDQDGLAWELVGPGVQASTEESLLAGQGRVVDLGTADPLAKQWAATFTERYESLADRLPVFAKLRNCIDLAVVGAILAKGQLFQRAGMKASLLTDAASVDVARYPAPRTTPSRASFVQRGQEYIVSISGGVDLDSWAVLDKMSERVELERVRTVAAAPRAAAWWWD